MIGYKLATYYDGTYFQPCIVTLDIPDDATVVDPYTHHSWMLKEKYSFKSNKHRCNKANVIYIEDLQFGNLVQKAYSLFVIQTIISKYSEQIKFRPHLTIERYVENYPGGVYEPSEKSICLEEINESEFCECGEGIHFFLTKQDAKDYCKPTDWAVSIMKQLNFYICQEETYDRLQNSSLYGQ